jgi:hypothetical protein
MLATGVAAALTLACSAVAQSGTYSDPAGDAPGGAPDITTVSVSSTANAGEYDFQVNMPGATLTSSMFVDVYLDTNADNAADYLIRLYGNGPRIEISRSTGSGWSAYTANLLEGTSSLQPETIRLGRADIGGASTFNFWVTAWNWVSNSSPPCCSDSTAEWNFALPAGSTPTTTTTTTTPTATTPTATTPTTTTASTTTTAAATTTTTASSTSHGTQPSIPPLPSSLPSGLSVPSLPSQSKTQPTGGTSTGSAGSGGNASSAGSSQPTGSAGYGAKVASATAAAGARSPLALHIAGPSKAVTGELYVARLELNHKAPGVTLSCRAAIGGRTLVGRTSATGNGTSCIIAVPTQARGKLLRLFARASVSGHAVLAAALRTIA